MTEPNIALLRKSGEYLLALTRLGDDNQWWATSVTGKPFRFSNQQVVCETDLVVKANDFPDWLNSVERIAAEINLKETWKVVLGEIPGLSLTDLADLVWVSPIKDVQIGALLLCLYRPGLNYFKVAGVTFTPLSEEEVATQIKHRMRQQESKDEEVSFVTWLGGPTETKQLTDRQLGWLELLRRYATEGDSSDVAKTAKEWLRKVQHSNEPRRLAFDLLVRQRHLDRNERSVYRRRVGLGE